MSITYNMSSLVTTNLVLALDAANTKSYPGTGTEVYDLTGNRFHMSLKNGVSFNSVEKCFEFNGINQSGICDGTISNSVEATVSALNFSGANQKTVVCIAQIRSIGNTNGSLFEVGDFGTTGAHYSLRQNGYTSLFGQFWGTPDYVIPYNGTIGYTMYSVVYGADRIGRTYGNNGDLLGQDDGAFNLLTAGSRPFTAGAGRGTIFSGAKIQTLLAYDRGLTVTEIQQNFQTFRKRYNL